MEFPVAIVDGREVRFDEHLERFFSPNLLQLSRTSYGVQAAIVYHMSKLFRLGIDETIHLCMACGYDYWEMRGILALPPQKRLEAIVGLKEIGGPTGFRRKT